MCAVPKIAVFWSSLISCILVILLRYCLIDFEMVGYIIIIIIIIIIIRVRFMQIKNLLYVYNDLVFAEFIGHN
jgi:hypothetical protein